MRNQVDPPKTSESLIVSTSLLQFLNRLTSAIQPSLQPEGFLLKLSEAMRLLLPVDRLAVAKYDASAESFYDVLSIVQNSTAADSMLSLKLAKEAMAERQVVWENVHHQSASSGLMATPLVFDGQAQGVLEIRSHDRPYSDRDAEALHNISSLIAAILAAFWRKDLNTQAAKSLAQKNSTAAMERQNKKLLSVVELARSIAHELNQPLTGISGYCALIKEEIVEGHPIARDVDEIQKQALRLEQLIHKFQNAAHVEYREDSRDKSLTD